MKTLNPEYVETIVLLVNRSPYFELLSMRILKLEIGSSLLEIQLSRKHLQPFGLVHGGVFASLIDATAFWAVFGAIEDAACGMTTVDLKLNYLAPAVEGRLIARGRQIRLGKTLGYAEATVSDANGALLAHGTSTLMVLPGRGLVANGPLPPKFRA